MTRKITTHNATIQTATVEVKTLTISGRQVTLSVFRQLQHAAVIDNPSLKLNGTPWGSVNYFWGESSDRGSQGYLHVVWQYGDELRRAVVNPHLPTSDSEWRTVRSLDRSRDIWQSALFALRALETPSDVVFTPSEQNAKYYSSHGKYHVGGLLVEHGPGSAHDSLSRIVAELIQSRDDAKFYRTPQEVRKSATGWVERLVGRSPAPSAAEALKTRDDYQIRHAKAKQDVEDREGAYCDLFAQLAALPQLFIAT